MSARADILAALVEAEEVHQLKAGEVLHSAVPDRSEQWHTEQGVQHGLREARQIVLDVMPSGEDS